MSKNVMKSKCKSKNEQMPSLVIPSVASSTPVIAVSERKADAEDITTKASEVSKKAQCDLCKLSYSTEKELTEHLLSLMHHTKMEALEQGKKHICTLCSAVCFSMIDYRKHLATKKHKWRLSNLRGDADNNSQWDSIRGDKRTLQSHNNFTSGTTTFNRQQFHRGSVFRGKRTSEFGANEQNQVSHAGFPGIGNSSKLSQVSKACFWSDRFHYNSNANHQSRDQVNNTYSTERQHFSGERYLPVSGVNQVYEPWGSGVYGDYNEYPSNEGFSTPHMGASVQDRSGMNSFYEKGVVENSKGPSFISVCNNAIAETWDDQLLLQQEQFLAGMDYENFTKKQSSYGWPYSANSDKQNYSGTQDGTQTRDETVMKEFFATFSKSVDHSSDLSAPMKVVHGKQQTAQDVINKSHARLFRSSDDSSDVSTHVKVVSKKHKTTDENVMQKSTVKTSRSIDDSSDVSTHVKVVSKKHKTTDENVMQKSTVKTSRSIDDSSDVSTHVKVVSKKHKTTDENVMQKSTVKTSKSSDASSDVSTHVKVVPKKDKSTDENVMQKTTVKTSRSSDASSDVSTPVKVVSKKHKTTDENVIQKSLPKHSRSSDASSDVNTHVKVVSKKHKTTDENVIQKSIPKHSRSSDDSSDVSTHVKVVSKKNKTTDENVMQKSTVKTSRSSDDSSDVSTHVKVVSKKHKTTDENVMQKSTVKTSRSSDASLDVSTPVKVVSKKHKTTDENVMQKSLPKHSRSSDDSSDVSTHVKVVSKKHKTTDENVMQKSTVKTSRSSDASSDVSTHVKVVSKKHKTTDENVMQKSTVKISRSSDDSSDVSTHVKVVPKKDKTTDENVMQKSLPKHSRSSDDSSDVSTHVKVVSKKHNTTDENVLQKSLPKQSRSSDDSSDVSTPVKVVHKKHKTTCETDVQESLSKLSGPIDVASNLDVRTQVSFTGGDVFKRLSTNLSETLDDSEEYLVKNKECDVHDNKQRSLQQLHNKSHTKASDRPDTTEKLSSDVSSTTSLLLKNGFSLTHSSSKNTSKDLFMNPSQPTSIRITLDDIKNSIEKSVLGQQEQHQEKLKTSKPPKSKRKRSSSRDAVPDTTSECTNVTLEKSLSKLVYKSQLSKDIIKKIVNAPHSRDERLQLAKMFQSRDEHKTVSNAPRTNLQLEGLYDSFIVSPEVVQDVSQNCEVQTIKLEDLPYSVRSQILGLVDEDVSSQFREHETRNISPPDQLVKQSLMSETDVIVLSDDEYVIEKKRKLKKNKTSNMIMPIVLNDATKRKKLAGPTSETGLKCSVASSKYQHEVSELPHINHKPGRDIEQPPKKQRKLCADNGIISCSSNVELDTDKQKCPRKEESHELIKTSVSSCISKTSTTGTKPNIFLWKKEQPLSSDQNQSHLNSSNFREESPTLTNLSVPERFSSVKKSGTDVSSKISSSSQSCVQLINDVSSQIPDTLLVSSKVQTNSHQLSPQTDTVGQLSEPYTEINSSAMHSKIISSTLHVGLKPPSPDTEVGPPSPETEVRPSSPGIKARPDAEVTTQQKSSMKPTETSSTLQTVLSNTSIAKRLTLPPSMWLNDRIPSSHSCENNNISTTVRSSLLLDLDNDTKVEDTTETSTVTIDDAEDSEQISNNMSNATPAVINESSSRIMSELLVLSEREEDVKNEKMSMDLRLSRLHKLLEQAVVQINKCTDRRKQLHEEEQELSKQRLSLFREILSTTEAASLNQNGKSNITDISNQTSKSGVFSDDHSQTSGSDQSLMQNQIPVLSTKSISCTENGPTKSIVPASTSTQCDETSVLSLSENIQGTSLSRDDWLAKFSSYLPSVSSREGNQVTVARAFYLASHSQLKGLIHHSSIPISSLNLSLPSDEAGNEQGKSSCQLTENGEMRNQDSGQKT